MQVAIKFLLFIILALPVQAVADWQSDLEGAGFDIVETFDQLNDWSGTSTGVGYYFNNLPTKSADNSASIWNMYYYQSSTDSTYDWIANHGAANVWQGTGKSLRLDLSQQGTVDHKGPSRFGLYFTLGDGYATSGTIDSGYDDIYIFYMVKMPYNHFPYRDESGNFTGYWSYYKFNTLVAGAYSASSIYDEYAQADGQGQVYGQSHYLPDIKTGATYGYELFFKPGLRLDSAYDADWNNDLLYEAYDAVDGGGTAYSIKPFLGTAIGNEQWFGIEFHQTTGTAGNADAVSEMWLYDAEGNVTKIFTKTDGVVVEAGQDYNYNKFFFGGNHSFLIREISEALDMAYYVDDFIIDGSRIGPTYFAMLGVNATLTGTAVTGGVTETELAGDDQTIIITLDGDTFIATACADNAATTALLAGFNGSLSGAGSWDDEANWTYADCIRNSDTQITLIVKVDAYDVSADETITATIPASILTGSAAIVASPVITITHLDPPVISGVTLTGELSCPSDPTTKVLGATTDESATCKGSLTDEAYADMDFTFSGGGGTTHTTSLVNLDCNAAYTYYIRCIDGSGNANATSTEASFSIVASTESVGSVRSKEGAGSVRFK